MFRFGEPTYLYLLLLLPFLAAFLCVLLEVLLRNSVLKKIP